MAQPNSWKPVVQTDTTGNWYDNAIRFRTKEEALRSARDLMGRWMLVLACDAHPSDDAPNYAYTEDGRLVELPKIAVLPPTKPTPDSRIAAYIAEIEQPGIPYVSTRHNTLHALNVAHGRAYITNLINQYFAEVRDWRTK